MKCLASDRGKYFNGVNVRHNLNRYPVIRFVALGLLAVLLASCTPMQWTKPGQDPAQMREDIGACDRQAWMRAQSEAFTNPNYVLEPTVQRDQHGRPYVSWGQRYFPDRSIRELTLFEMCMRDRGYQYVPVQPERQR